MIRIVDLISGACDRQVRVIEDDVANSIKELEKHLAAAQEFQRKLKLGILTPGDEYMSIASDQVMEGSQGHRQVVLDSIRIAEEGDSSPGLLAEISESERSDLERVGLTAEISPVGLAVISALEPVDLERD